MGRRFCRRGGRRAAVPRPESRQPGELLELADLPGVREVRQHRRPQGPRADQERRRSRRPRFGHPLRQRRLRGRRDDESRRELCLSARHDGQDPDLGHPRRAVRRPGGGRRRRDAEKRRSPAPHPVRGRAGEPDQPVPLQQGLGRQGAREVKLWKLVFALALAAAAGCATTGDSDPRDPLEPLNRAVYSFNDGVDRAIAKPVATVYRDVVPEPLRNYVRNFFSNIGDLFIGVNNMLQGKPDEGFQDWARFAFNSVLGIFGINDVASDMGFEKHNEDFGQTLGRWGFSEGPYLVLPLLGSSDVRDGVGTAADLYYDPV